MKPTRRAMTAVGTGGLPGLGVDKTAAEGYVTAAVAAVLSAREQQRPPRREPRQ